MFARKLVLKPKSEEVYFANRIASAYYSALEEVAGTHGLQTLLALSDASLLIENPPTNTLEKSFDSSILGRINHSLTELYGIKGAQGMATRVGRSAFGNHLSQFGAMRGLVDPVFQALPLSYKIEIGLFGLAAIFTHFTDMEVKSAKAKNEIFLTVQNSPFAHEASATPNCHILCGTIQECMRYLSGGYEFSVIETDCQACNDTECVIKVGQQPMLRKL